MPFNALNSDEANVTAQVNALLQQPAALLCLATNLLANLPPYMPLLELYLRALYSIYNPQKLLLTAGGTGVSMHDNEGKESSSAPNSARRGSGTHSGMVPLISPAGYSAEDNICKLMQLYAGKEQEMVDDLKGKYSVPRSRVATLLTLQGTSLGPHGDAPSNSALQLQYKNSITSAPGKQGSGSSAAVIAAANNNRVGNLLWTAFLQAAVWTLLLAVAYLGLSESTSLYTPGMVRLAT